MARWAVSEGKEQKEEVAVMTEMHYIFGPVPSRRLGVSLGISPIPKKTCNYSCIYCQLGRTDHLTNQRKMYFRIQAILEEFDLFLMKAKDFEVVTIVGEGEPTLYLGLGKLIKEIKKRTEKPVAVITNGALLYDPQVRAELGGADIVLPTVDAYDQTSFEKINRPFGTLKYEQVIAGLITFSETFAGQLWIEIMLVDGINDDDESLEKFARILQRIRYDRLYLNTPVRPPAEPYAKAVSSERMKRAAERLGGISIDILASKGFHSEIPDHKEAILSIIKRHPMNRAEIEGFLKSRGCEDINAILDELRNDSRVISIFYEGIETFRLG